MENLNLKDEIQISKIKDYLADDSFNFEYKETVTSTNLLLKEDAEKENANNKILIAEHQTQGRGRLGRSFYSPQNSGIYLSILLRPNFSTDNITLVTPMVAVAVCKTIEKLSNQKINPKIKWVNDVLIDDKKVCGILTESKILNGKIDYLIIGVGINLYNPENDFPDDIKDIAGFIFKEKSENLKNKFIAEFLKIFFEIYKTLPSKDFVKEYRKRLNILNKDILVISKTEKKEAKVLDLDDDCRLLVKYKDAEEEYINSGEISIRKKGEDDEEK